eukprot:scaffold6323_cov121-Isochrysis_galbana.AAC.12
MCAAARGDCDHTRMSSTVTGELYRERAGLDADVGRAAVVAAAASPVTRVTGDRRAWGSQ